MPARLHVTLVALLIMVVALVMHTASQDSVAVGAVAHPIQVSAAEHAHSAVFADPEHFGAATDEPAPACPSDRRSTHDDSGTPVSRLAASGSAFSVPAVFSEPAPCVDGAAAVAPDRSVPTVQVSGVDLCIELCVSRR
ncbi:hypothetical protein [Pseudonocardia sp. N23]|uniref:hypothetical protein n=1 Tax=Pseudonocardia sp. N23 TaxID=1987376 RepID=UPI000BFE31A4|nr:hypothetical protein [Pseudonocardia sp. N23]GAY12598.1 hypothetical protein TOK_1086 [Pseudonocardia sp. N23]